MGTQGLIILFYFCVHLKCSLTHLKETGHYKWLRMGWLFAFLQVSTPKLLLVACVFGGLNSENLRERSPYTESHRGTGDVKEHISPANLLDNQSSWGKARGAWGLQGGTQARAQEGPKYGISRQAEWATPGQAGQPGLQPHLLWHFMNQRQFSSSLPALSSPLFCPGPESYAGRRGEVWGTVGGRSWSLPSLEDENTGRR